MSGKKRLFRGVLCMLLALVFALSAGASAHSGRTDSSGGHRDNKNKSGLGSYHYHCGGHPAHLHSSGVCPYDSSAKKAKATATPKPTTTPLPVKYVDGIAIPDAPGVFPLQKGSRGESVRQVQQALIDLGYLEDEADGVFGEITLSALAAYCEARFDSVFLFDGAVDEELYIFIMKEYWNAVLSDAA